MTEQARKEVAELRAIARLLLEGLDKLEAQAGEVDEPAKPREPPPEAYAQVMARRRKRGG